MCDTEHENLRNIAAFVVLITIITSLALLSLSSGLKSSWFILPGKDEYIISTMSWFSRSVVSDSV